MHPNALASLVVPLLVLAGCSGADQTRAGAPTATVSIRATATPQTLAPTGGPPAASAPATGTATPSRTTPTGAPTPAMRNGRIQDAADYLARVRTPCLRCAVEGESFDRGTRRLLVTRRGPTYRVVGLAVVGATRVLADLSCPDDFPCRGDDDGADALGPGADELTVWSPPDQVRVIGYDGTVRGTIDLSAILDRSSEIGGLAWSPDGTRLAVRTSDFSSGLVSRLWLVDRDGSDPQRVHTAAYDGPPGGTPLTYLWSLAWSPDGRRLGFIEEHARLYSGSEQSLWMGAVSLLLPRPGEQEAGAATILYDYTILPFDPAMFLWSPDGTRVAVRILDEVLELSAEDGRALTRHPFACSMADDRCPPLIWPARQTR